MTMEIFNWIHRKLHPATNYSPVSYSKVISDALIEDGGWEGELRSVAFEGEKGTEALLLNHVLAGFLTIGTFGHGHPLLLPSILPSIQEEEQQEAEAAEGLGVAAAGVAPTALAVARRNSPATFESKDEWGVEEEKKSVGVMAVVEEPKRPSLEVIEPLLKEDRERKDKGRTTLADLFATDAATFAGSPSGKKSPPEATSGSKPQASCRAKCCKKPLKKGEGSPPPPAIAKKLHRLMTKMLKRKIHPDAALVRGASDAGAAVEEGRLLPQAIGCEDCIKISTYKEQEAP